ncbi:MAG: hypothetical protein IJ575_10680 [Selenomonadaceae bacterium]|nr:hypothetical protein [Selenomonadaceae bacterium]
MEDKNARIAEIESQIKQLQSEITDLKSDQFEAAEKSIDERTTRILRLPVMKEIFDEIERGEWSPGGKHYPA